MLGRRVTRDHRQLHLQVDTEVKWLSWSGYSHCKLSVCWAALDPGGRGAAAAAGQDHGAGTQTPPRPTRDKEPLLPQLGVSQILWSSCPISLPHALEYKDLTRLPTSGSGRLQGGSCSHFQTDYGCSLPLCLGAVLKHLAYLCVSLSTG